MEKCWILLSLLLTFVSAQVTEGNATTSDTMTTSDTTVTSRAAEPGFIAPNITISRVYVTPYDITIGWTLVDSNNAVKSYTTSVSSENGDYNATFSGDAVINSTGRMADIGVPTPDTLYAICLHVKLRDEAAIKLGIDSTMDICDDFKSIPTYYMSSFIALGLVLGYFLLLVVVAIIAYNMRKEVDTDKPKSIFSKSLDDKN